MTLENLIKIVIEAVEKVLMLQKISVTAVCFDKKNMDDLKTASLSINNWTDINEYSDDLDISQADIVFVDYIPAEYLPELALGLNISPFAKIINSHVLSGRQIFILKETPVPCMAPEGCKALLSSYSKMLSSYGYQMLYKAKLATNSSNESDNVSNYSPYENKIYTGNVLSRNDLITHTQNNQIIIDKSVIITDLAAETARNMKINIIRA